MSENTSDFFEELDTLTAHDPLRKKDAVLSDTHGPSTIMGQEAEPLTADDWALEELHVMDR